jgi:hypothetical protein
MGGYRPVAALQGHRREMVILHRLAESLLSGTRTRGPRPVELRNEL